MRGSGKSSRLLIATAITLLAMAVIGAARDREEPVTVTVIQATAQPIYNSVTASGTVESERSYVFLTDSNATVCELYVREGDSVREGEALWALAPTERIEWDEALLRSALASVRPDGERITTAPGDSGVIVTAPADCTLLTVPVLGQGLSPGLPYARAADLTALCLRIEIPEAFAPAVLPGQFANVTVSATGSQLGAVVRSLSPVARQAISLTGSNSAVTVEATLSLNTVPEALRPGYSANAKIFVDEKASAVVLPYEAVHQEGLQEYVFIPDTSGRARIRPVETGYALSKSVEVVSGVSEGEYVILTSDGELEEGCLVEVRP